jgi:hypothetical protein
MTYASPDIESQDTNPLLSQQSSALTASSNQSAETLHPARFEEVTGIAPPKDSVGINLLDFALDEDIADNDETEGTNFTSDGYLDGDPHAAQYRYTQANNNAMQWK